LLFFLSDHNYIHTYWVAKIAGKTKPALECAKP